MNRSSQNKETKIKFLKWINKTLWIVIIAFAIGLLAGYVILSPQIGEKENKIRELTDQIQNLSVSVLSLQKQIDDLKTENQNLNQKINEKNAKIKELEDKIRKIDTTRGRILSIVEALDIEKFPESFYPVEEIVDMGEPAIPILLELLDNDSFYHRWASVYALSRISNEVNREKQKEIITHLKKRFNDTDSTIRVIAAGIAVSLGESSGIPILIASLKSDEVKIFSKPPELLKDYSIRILKYYTQQNIESPEDWEQWWNKNKDIIIWNEKEKKFIS